MWATMFHLAIGNALIGVCEGALLGYLFDVPRGKVIGIMILANYFSAWVGGIFLTTITPLLPIDLNNGWRWFWIFVVATYAMTVLLEWPFIAWLMRRAEDWLKRSLRASVIVQAASYIPLFGWYWMASGTSLYTKTHVVSASDLSLPETVAVYFSNAYSHSSSARHTQRIFELHSTNTNDRLFVHPSSGNTNHWDLAARLETSDYDKPRLVDLLTNMDVEAVRTAKQDVDGSLRDNGTWFNFGSVPALGNAVHSKWKFRAGFWPVDGLRAENKETKETIKFSYETPFGAWMVRNAFHLPSDKVLFQLGRDQICLFDPMSRKISLLCHGRGPVAVIENKSNPTR
ncbi:MAG: hypothetical protein NT105_07900 [Verrucomicrobia bacterium]|nr:hypothetical protein [Verrucomicrobiota bacterium]